MSDILVTPPTPTAIPKAEAPTSPVAQASFDSAEARSAALRQNIGILQKKIEQLADICGVPKISSGTNEVEAVAQMAKVVDVMIKMHLDQRLPSLPKEGDYFVTPKELLEAKLSQRLPREVLIQRGVLRGEAGVAPRLLQQQQELRKQQLEARLGKHLAARPAREDLVARHIIPETEAAAESLDAEQAAQRQQIEQTISRMLSDRPARDMLVQRQILPDAS